MLARRCSSGDGCSGTGLSSFVLGCGVVPPAPFTSRPPNNCGRYPEALQNQHTLARKLSTVAPGTHMLGRRSALYASTASFEPAALPASLHPALVQLVSLPMLAMLPQREYASYVELTALASSSRSSISASAPLFALRVSVALLVVGEGEPLLDPEPEPGVVLSDAGMPNENEGSGSGPGIGSEIVREGTYMLRPMPNPTRPGLEPPLLLVLLLPLRND